jgi:hypothetical protein
MGDGNLPALGHLGVSAVEFGVMDLLAVGDDK